ncbi:MAG: hypothetical protein M1274_05420 [Actinobacteria bacterium]|nr:hypothetical protein [Actinomycetota bacterium]
MRSLHIGATTVTPVVKSLVMSTGGSGVIWNRPWGVLVSREGRSSQKRIFNMTRLAQLSIVVLGVAAAFWLVERFSGRKEMLR